MVVSIFVRSLPVQNLAIASVTPGPWSSQVYTLACLEYLASAAPAGQTINDFSTAWSSMAVRNVCGVPFPALLNVRAGSYGKRVT